MRILRILALIVAVFALGNYFVHHSKAGREVDADVQIEKLVTTTQARLPIQISANATLDEVTYENRTLQFHGAAKKWFAQADGEEGRVHDAMLANYCKMKTLVEANVPVEVILSVPPESLNDRATERRTVFKPAECQT